MIAFSLAELVLIAIATLVPLRLLSRRRPLTWWDRLSPFLGVPAWYLLIAADIGATATLSNLVVEMFWVLGASIASPWLRWGLTCRRGADQTRLDLLLSLAPVLCAVGVRLMMPSLPE
jgi:hypothetical protein